LEEDKLRIAARFLKGPRDEDNGVYMEMLSGKSNIEGQDGGMATSLLLSGLQKGLFDAAIVVKRTDGYNSEAVVVENSDDIIQAKGTKYLRVKMMALVADLIAKGKRRLAMVGTACEIRSVRQIQEILLPKYPDLDLTLVGLFCFEAFDYEKLNSETKRLMGVDLDKADKTQKDENLSY
jgi:coenzyme F420 hydrogenase subunit beta